MGIHPQHQHAGLCLAAAFLTSCGNPNTGPTEVPFGQTAFVVVVNPVVNALNQASVPPPGPRQSEVSVAVVDGPSGTTDATGVIVLSPVAAGTRTLALSDGTSSGQVQTAIAARDLRELAVAFGPTGATLIANIQCAFGGEVLEVTPTASVAAVNAALARSNVIVFFRSGTYTGDLRFAGSDVTLFGEGPRGGSVTVNGNIEVSGSRNRIRGARITGSLTVPGSDFGMSFSRIAGPSTISGSNTTLLNNAFCSSVTISGSGARVLGNAGIAPAGPVAGGC
jgi:hypothetical protein